MECPENRHHVPEFGGRIGFLGISYMNVGGTEVWHHTIIEHLPKEMVAGFVCYSESLCDGDLRRFSCPVGVGKETAKQLAKNCDVLVVWAIGPELVEILPTPRPKVILVNHGDAVSEWSTKKLEEMAPHADFAVYLCPSAAETVPKGLPSRLIRNAPDPRRIVPREGREATRRWLGVEPHQKMLLSLSRLAPEKGVMKLIEMMDHLPDDYFLAIAGDAVGWYSTFGRLLEYKQSKRIKLVGAVQHPGDLLAAADAYLSASKTEGYGLSTAEAMLAGLPVISTPVGFLEEEPHLARIASLDANAEEWATIVQHDFDDVLARGHRIWAAQQAMQGPHSVERFIAEWMEVIDSVSQLPAPLRTADST